MLVNAIMIISWYLSTWLTNVFYDEVPNEFSPNI